MGELTLNSPQLGLLLDGRVSVLTGVKSGIAYQFPMVGGDESHYNHDDNWQWVNGLLDYTPPTDPINIAALDFSQPTMLLVWTTLIENNKWGNKSRFTSEKGDQDYTKGRMQDQLTGAEWYILTTGLTATSQSAALTEAYNLTVDGKSDWFAASVKFYSTLIYMKQNSGDLSYAPINDVYGIRWTSTNHRTGSGRGVEIFNTANSTSVTMFRTQTYSTALYSMPCRIHINDVI